MAYITYEPPQSTTIGEALRTLRDVLGKTFSGAAHQVRVDESALGPQRLVARVATKELPVGAQQTLSSAGFKPWRHG